MHIEWLKYEETQTITVQQITNFLSVCASVYLCERSVRIVQERYEGNKIVTSNIPVDMHIMANFRMTAMRVVNLTKAGT